MKESTGFIKVENNKNRKECGKQVIGIK